MASGGNWKVQLSLTEQQKKKNCALAASVPQRLRQKVKEHKNVFVLLILASDIPTQATISAKTAPLLSHHLSTIATRALASLPDRSTTQLNPHIMAGNLTWG